MPKKAKNPCLVCGAGDTYTREKGIKLVCRKCGSVTTNPYKKETVKEETDGV